MKISFSFEITVSKICFDLEAQTASFTAQVKPVTTPAAPVVNVSVDAVKSATDFDYQAYRYRAREPRCAS